MKTWQCGDCHRVYPKSRLFCNHPFDDYLALRGGSIESAISQAVDRAIAPLVEQALARTRGYKTWTAGNKYYFRWVA